MEYKKLLVRVSPELAEQLRITIIKNKISINKYVVDAIKEKLEREEKSD